MAHARCRDPDEDLPLTSREELDVLDPDVAGLA
jgi:hypothetical protein